MDHKVHLRGRNVFILAVMLAMPVTAIAQIDEVVVIARKRQENLQDVPLSISVLSGTEVVGKGIRTVVGVTEQVSSLTFDEGFAQSDTRVVMRGLSAITGRQNVATLVDGIDVSTESISSGGGSILLVNRLVDIERIEVVKGPQMVQYGRSAFNGAIQYVTKDPSESLEMDFGIDANDQDHYTASGSVSGPLLGENLGVRLSGTWWDETGIYRNSITGARIGGDEGYALAAAFLAEPRDDLTIRLRAEYQDQQSQPSPVAYLPFTHELDTPQAALDAQVVRCFPDIVEKTRTPALDDRADRIYDPEFAKVTNANSGPFCESPLAFVAGQIPDPDEAQIRLATNPFSPGQDFMGFDHNILRLSLIASWNTELGVFTSWTGYTNDDTFESQDAGIFGVPGPPPYLDDNVNIFLFEQDKKTRQISQEIRYDSNLAGPINVSIGGQYFQERVNNQANSLTVQASGSHCAWNSGTGATFDDLGFVTDGSGCYGYTEIPVAPFIGGHINFGNGEPYGGIAPYRNPSPTDRDTEHWSVYGMLALSLSPSTTLTLEGRYNHETVDQYGPIFLKPNASGGATNWSVCGIFFRECDADFLFHAPNTFGADDIGGPFWSQANFEAAYDQWDPNAPVSSTDPTLLKDAISEECLADPAVQERLANIEQGGTDPFDLFNPWCVGRLSRTDKWFTPKFTLDWRMADNSMMYISWARSQKPGGFATGTIGSNGLRREVAEFEPEVMDVYEIGAHTEWLDRTLVVNGAAFFQDYTDKQTVLSALGQDGRSVARIANANSAEVWGVELEMNWRPATPFLGGNWAVTAGYTWLDTEYVNAEFDSLVALTITTAGNCRPTQLQSGTGDVVVPACIVSYDGNELEGAPPNKFVGTVGYRLPLGNDMSLLAEANVRWVDRRFVEVSNRSFVGAYSNTDLRLGVQGDAWDIMAYVTNVFDDDSARTAFSGRPALGCCFAIGSGLDIAAAQPTPDRAVMVDLGFTSTAILAPPRIIGVRANFRFGGG